MQTTLAKSGGICFTSASARIASQTLFELSFRLKPLLDLPKCALDENTALSRCLSHPDLSVGKVSRSTATNSFTMPFRVDGAATSGSACGLRGRSTRFASVNGSMAICSICWPRKSEAGAPNVLQEHQIDLLPGIASQNRIAAKKGLHTRQSWLLSIGLRA